MKSTEISKIIRSYIPNKIKKFVSYSEDIEYGAVSFSQFGEDVVMRAILREKKNGFYVDIGAHHPFRFSNTYLFYKNGWNGINIDPKPGFKKLFDKYREKDINVETGISDEEATMDYYIQDHPAMNTFSKEWVLKNDLKKDKISLNVCRLETVLEMYLDSNAKIDFMNIDTEGFDYKVLVSNNWNMFKPGYIIIEDNEFNYENPDKSKIYKFLTSNSYSLVAGIIKSYIYKYDGN